MGGFAGIRQAMLFQLMAVVVPVQGMEGRVVVKTRERFEMVVWVYVFGICSLYIFELCCRMELCGVGIRWMSGGWYGWSTGV